MKIIENGTGELVELTFWEGFFVTVNQVADIAMVAAPSFAYGWENGNWVKAIAFTILYTASKALLVCGFISELFGSLRVGIEDMTQPDPIKRENAIRTFEKDTVVSQLAFTAILAVAIFAPKIVQSIWQ